MASRKSSTTTAPEAQASVPESTETKQYEPDSVLVGRLTADPQLRQTQNGKAITSLRVAVQETDPQQYIDIVCFGRTAEVCCQYLKRGRRVQATGRQQERAWIDRDGNPRVSAEIVAFRVKFLSGRGKAPVAEKELS
jgi:single-strand DNA-binding protein